MTFNYTG